MRWIRQTPQPPKEEQVSETLDYGEDIPWPETGNVIFCENFVLRQESQESPIEKLDRKILAWRREDTRIVPWDPFRGGRLLVIGQLFQIRYDITRSIRDLDAAIEQFEHAARRLKPPDNDWMTSKADLAFALEKRFRQAKSIEDLDRAIQIRRDLSWHLPSGAMELHTFLLSETLSQRFEATGCRSDATEAIGMLQSIAEATTDLDHKAGYLSSLSHIQSALFLKFRIPEELRRSVETARLSTQVTTENTAASEQAVYFSRLGRALEVSWNYTSAKMDLEDAINAYEKALQLLKEKDENFLIMQSNLGCLLRLRFNEAGRWNDLKRAFELAQNAVEKSPSKSVEVPGRMVNLSAVLETRWEVKGLREDLENAIQCIRSAINVAAKEHEHYSTVHGSLCRMLQSKFELDGLIEDLYSAIESGEISIANHDDPVNLDNLANAYQRRYDWLQSTESLDRAIVLYEKAIETAISSKGQASSYINMSNALLKRRERYKDNGGSEIYGDDLSRAIELARKGTKASKNNQMAVLSKMTLASGLNDKGSEDGNLEMLDEAIEVYKTARDGAFHKSYWHRGSLYNNLGVTLQRRYRISNSLKDLEKRAECFRKAYNLTPKDHPKRALYMGNFGTALSELSSRTNSTRKKKKAKKLLSQSALDLNLPVSLRILFLIHTAEVHGTEDAQQATRCLVQATKMLSMLGSRAVTTLDRQLKLSEYPGLASSAVAFLFASGSPILEVIEVLEIGRGVILGQYLETRSDLTVLKASHPIIGHNFEHLQRQLDHGGNGFETSTIRSGSIRQSHQPRLIHQYEEMLQEIRRLPGFQRFLLGPSNNELHLLSQEGPLVMLNSHPNRCDAIIVNGGRIFALPLPSLKMRAIEANSKRIRALSKEGSTPESLRALQKILRWLWDSIAKPVLEALDFKSTPPEGITWPKIWWIPTGRLVYFPIHAAGYHAIGSQDTVMDRVVSCYTTTIKALDYSRKRREHVKGKFQPNMLLVAMSETPARASLPHALEEVIMVEGIIQSCISTDILHQPTKAEVLEGLKNHTMVHFACHGEVDGMDPSKSKLLLNDWESAPLSVEDIVSLRLENAMFAYICACQSADNANGALMDEGLHIAGALQLAGYPQLIATLWPVDDEVSKSVSESIYSSMIEDEHGTLAVAEALNTAIRKLRDESRYAEGILLDDDPLNWAPYIYMGA